VEGRLRAQGAEGRLKGTALPQKSVPPPPPPPRLEGAEPSGSRPDAAAADAAAAAEEGPGDAGAEVGSRPDSLSLRRRSPSARIATIS
jgi:hypothetical protein